MSNTLNLGTDGNWAVKKDSLLGYNSENGNFKPLPFNFTRASSATVVNKDGLIEIVGSGKARIDFKDDANGALLLEPTRSNDIIYSEYLTKSNWLKIRSSVSESTIISPNGNKNAFILESDISASTVTYYAAQDVSVVSGDNYTNSVFIKKGNSDFAYLEIGQRTSNFLGNSSVVFQFSTETLGSILSSGIFPTNLSAKVEKFVNGWYRLSISGTISGATTINRMVLGVCNSLTSTSYASTTNDSVYFYGAQVEQGSYATSYIPTQGSAVTRVADVSNQIPPSGIIGQTEGTLFVDVDFKTLSGTNMFVSIRPDASNKIEIYRSDAIIYAEFTYSSNSFNFNKPNATVGRYKIAVAYSSGSSAMYINGIFIGSNTEPIAFTSTLNDIYINSRVTTFIEQSSYNEVKLYNTRLSNAELQALTQ